MIYKNNTNQPQASLLIDASIYIFQYYFSLPDHWFSKAKQWPTAAVYGYTTFLIKLLEQEKPQRVAACFDESLTSCFRNEVYADYKVSRALPDEALAFQLNACKKVTELLGIKTFSSKRYEADDLLGSLYQSLLRSKTPIAILTRDKDLGQIIKRDQDYLWDYSGKPKGKSVSEVPNSKGIKYFADQIEEKFGVKTYQLVDYLSLVGDSIDDIPGVPGIGKKTAVQLLHYFDSIDQLFKRTDELSTLPIRGAKNLPHKLFEYKGQIKTAQCLATIVTDLRLINKVDELKWMQPNFIELDDFIEEMGFIKLRPRIQSLKS